MTCGASTLTIKITAKIDWGKIVIPATISGGSNAKLANGIDASNRRSTVPGWAATLHAANAKKIKAGIFIRFTPITLGPLSTAWGSVLATTPKWLQIVR